MGGAQFKRTGNVAGNVYREFRRRRAAELVGIGADRSGVRGRRRRRSSVLLSEGARMDNTRGPVVVGMDGPDMAAASAGPVGPALVVAGREALRRGVDLRLVYGRATLPSWPRAAEALECTVERIGAEFPGLAVAVVVYPGDAGAALSAAAASAGLVVLPADAGDAEAIGRLVSGAPSGTVPIVVVATAQPETSNAPATRPVVADYEPVFV